VGYRFGPFEADFQIFELRREGSRVRIDRKVFDLLRYLIEHRERVVDKAELLREVWSGDVVVDAVVATAVARLRKALGQAGAQGGPIQTVHGRGYRFISEVQPHTPLRNGGAGASHGLAQLDTDLHPGLRDPFVGRDEVLQRLSGALDKALAGTVRVRLLMGEPGIGKTRICQELAVRARLAGARVCTGHCYEAERAEPLWPWIQILRQAGQGHGDALRALPEPLQREIVALAPELAGAAGSTPPATLDAEPRLSVFDAITRMLRELSRREPIVIVLDDLHWADPASLAFLGYFVDEIGGARILVIATVRDVELLPGHPHLALLERLERSPTFKRIALGGLSVEDVARYLAEFTGQNPAAGLPARVHECTGGNAFFVRETARTLAWEALSAGQLQLDDVKLPESARDVVRRRVALLPEPTRRMLAAASVIGARFELNALAPMLDMEMQVLLAAIDRAVLARLMVRDDGVGRFAFSHTLVRDTLYEDLPSAAKCELHLAAGRALEQQRALRPAAASEIAFHLHRALPQGDGNKVLEYGVQAAKQASAAGDHEAAARWYGCAYEGLCFVRDADVNRSAEVMLALGREHGASGRSSAAREALDRVLELSTLGGASESWATAARQELERLEREHAGA
jgi:predicted ATPase/DNA-binding winged helix-turn-helix (wHTH) protein